MKKVVSIVGTRADIIKMSALIHELNKSEIFQHIVLYSNQHQGMGIRKLKEFNIGKFFIAKHIKNSSNDLSRLSLGIDELLKKLKPFLVLVHGDTLTAISGALVAYAGDIRIAHVEAGLRSGNLYSPFPEEINRTIISKLASINLCPTDIAFKNLLSEGVSPEKLYLTGNTVVDVIKKLSLNVDKYSESNTILVTTHRRESWLHLPETMCKVIKRCLAENNNLYFTVLSHPNPLILNKYEEELSEINRVHLICEEKYVNCINHIHNSRFIATDSCGIQEEASILGKPTLILRKETERPESLEYGCAKLCGIDFESIYQEINKLINNKNQLELMSNPVDDAFGDGTACQKIRKIIENFMRKENA